MKEIQASKPHHSEAKVFISQMSEIGHFICIDDHVRVCFDPIMCCWVTKSNTTVESASIDM